MTLRRLLSRYAGFSGMAAKEFLAYNVWFWMNLFTSAVAMTIFVFFWKAIYAQADLIAGLGFQQTLNYVLLAQVIAGVGESGILWTFGYQLREGRIALELLRPLDFQGMLYAFSAGNWLTGLLSRTPLLLLALLYGLQPPADPLAYACFAVSFLLGASVMFFFEWMLGCLAFYTTEVWGLGVTLFAIQLFFSGALVPLDMMPEGLRLFAQILPFHQIVYTPVSFLAGITPVAQAPQVFLGQVAWIVGLAVASRWVFSRAVRAVTVQGG
ncbi:ABC-2 family transporter protein [Calidithermus terrae]|uniref:ABC-2 family transporter protein n=1 Tax=Calidithermus terrae TaxID=1408545 RepID=A0A399EDM1_9DEIN|nr:ABC-2 family transporter protein [Calidithermus terrae]RIH81896.1 ABC-2 family transporter protein [Calidithermus terrae]